MKNPYCFLKSPVLIFILIIFSSLLVNINKSYSQYKAYGWGSDDYGQLGIGNYYYYPRQIDTNKIWINVACGENHIIALKKDGTIWGMGNNDYGQLGDSTNTDRNYFIQIGNDTDWIKVSCGYNTTHAIKKDGTLWAWGDNHYGQCGDGAYNNKNYPVKIGTDNKWIDISCGFKHTIGLKSDKTIWDGDHVSMGYSV